MHLRVSFFLLSVLAVAPLQAQIGEIEAHAGPPATSASSTDRSALWLDSQTRATVLLIDPKGRRVGLDPETQKPVKEIADARSEIDFVANRYTGEPQSEAYQRIGLEPAARGTYHVILRGLQGGPYEVNISAQSREGSSEPSKRLEGLISEGEVKRFQLTFDPAPNSSLSVVED